MAISTRLTISSSQGESSCVGLICVVCDVCVVVTRVLSLANYGLLLLLFHDMIGYFVSKMIEKLNIERVFEI